MLAARGQRGLEWEAMGGKNADISTICFIEGGTLEE